MNSSINTRRIAIAALFTAASLLASFVELPIFPAAPWLKYDPSGIVCLMAALTFGSRMGIGVAIVSWLPHVLLDPIGSAMGIVSTCAFVGPAGALYGRAHSRGASLVGMLVGAVLSIALSCGLNLVVTPLYTSVSMDQVAAMILPILLPFNTLKMTIGMVAGQVLLAPCLAILSAQGMNHHRSAQA